MNQLLQKQPSNRTEKEKQQKPYHPDENTIESKVWEPDSEAMKVRAIPRALKQSKLDTFHKNLTGLLFHITIKGFQFK